MANLVIRPALLGHMYINASVSVSPFSFFFMVIRGAEWYQRDLEQVCVALQQCPLVFRV